MNKNIYTGILVCILVIGGMVFWLTRTVPSQSEIDLVKDTVSKVDSKILTNATVAKIVKLDKNGNIPVSVQGRVSGKSNPFK
jgi:hypothetical protein